MVIRRSGQVAGLLALCAVGAELLAAYSDNTGNPGGIAFALVFFSALYGAPALLTREFVRRQGWGWPSMLLIFAALGIAEACLIDQSMFSSDYQGYEGWEQTREATLIPALGVSAYNAYNFVIGHVIFSFAAPVALSEAGRPERAGKPWLGRVGIVVAGLAYVSAAALVAADSESRSGSPPQLVVAAILVVGCIVAAMVVGQRTITAKAAELAHDHTGSQLSLRRTFGVAFVAALCAGLVGEDWIGFAVSVVATAVLGLVVLRMSRGRAWSLRHTAAVGLAFLLVRGTLAFTYYPLLGDVAAGPKYAHNVVMLLIVLLAGWLALRRHETAPAGAPG